MQVTQVNDFITHAIIGGKAHLEAGISSDPAFFNILSSTLYKDQILAVVRETLCNAWDAHIEAGVTDKPVEITLTQEKFTIRDFGKGIHPDDMQAIYLTYGNSTKKNDGTQTGGFGLGCKSPWAYVDHFEVQSCHAGKKTIYNLTKSSAATQGKPGATVIVSVPSNETGLQVSLKIKQSNDYRRFLALITRIVSNGDMNMTLNGQKIETIGFDASKQNFFLTQTSLLDELADVMVRYGNVIYPVDGSNTEISSLYKKVVNQVRLLGGSYGSTRNKYSIVFQAPPHSIAVTPSRESLSMQDHTIKTLNTLFEEYLQISSTKLVEQCNVYAEESIHLAVAEEKTGALLKRELQLPIPVEGNDEVYIRDLQTMAKRYMSLHYPAELEFRKKDITLRLNLMSEDKLINEYLVKSFLKHLDKLQSMPNIFNRTRTDWLHREIIGPLCTKLTKAGLNYKELFVIDSADDHVEASYKRRSNMPPMVEAYRSRPLNIHNCLPYLRNVVVISSTYKDLVDRVNKHPLMQKWGQYEGYLFYRTSLKAKEKAAAVQFFKDRGMVVIDLTFRQDYEPAPYRAPAEKKGKKVGLPILRSMYDDKTLDKPESVRFSTRNCLAENVERIEKPEFVIDMAFNRDSPNDKFDHNWTNDTSIYVVKLFGDKGGITNNVATYSKYLKEGVTKFEDYITDKVCDYILNSSNIAEFWSYNPYRLINRYSHRRSEDERIFKAIYTNKELRDHFGLLNNMTQEDFMYLAIWLQRVQYLPGTKILHVKKYLASIYLHPKNQELLNKITGNPVMAILDVNGIKTALKSKNTPIVTNKVVSVLLQLIDN